MVAGPEAGGHLLAVRRRRLRIEWLIHGARFLSGTEMVGLDQAQLKFQRDQSSPVEPDRAIEVKRGKTRKLFALWLLLSDQFRTLNLHILARRRAMRTTSSHTRAMAKADNVVTRKMPGHYTTNYLYWEAFSALPFLLSRAIAPAHAESWGIWGI